jgi:hypothetical protein
LELKKLGHLKLDENRVEILTVSVEKGAKGPKIKMNFLTMKN